ncbi:DNA polymerase III subunit delta' [Neomoorella mulderi]|uniref:DNA polymerase III subunit delta n=1 Tax=Moorella mulderi DSM 14980 TaxID=1122241 RepID=A0A151B218_9FIRM|nr:DNA polymerase III subunit delta' [Moorella mulderi]KYH33812.1 DNA polymerase III subunit delta' [Moorella mulderi DSM 14980]
MAAGEQLAGAKPKALMTARQQLRQALQRGKLVHAYLLAGGSEAARMELARYLAATLNCQEPREGEPCGRCRSCQQMAGGNHPDFYLFKPQGATLKIDQIRELERQLTFRAFQGGARVAVLAGADTMTEAAANCLLKTLEEPPEGAYLILLAAQPDLLLPTIRSRCQELHLGGEGGVSPAGATYWNRLAGAGLAAMLQEILPELEKEDDLPAVLQAMALACRDQLVWQLTGTATLLLQPGYLLPVPLSPAKAWRCFQLIQAARAAIERNGNRRLALEVLMFNLHRELASTPE